MNKIGGYYSLNDGVDWFPFAQVNFDASENPRTFNIQDFTAMDDKASIRIAFSLQHNWRTWKSCFIKYLRITGTEITDNPTINPTTTPTITPTVVPTVSPILGTRDPTMATSFPSINPTQIPTISPSKTPTKSTKFPSVTPTVTPTSMPTSETIIPTIMPTENPTTAPTMLPTNIPSTTPTKSPTRTPTLAPTLTPTAETVIPTPSPTRIQTLTPTRNPVTLSVGGGIDNEDTTLFVQNSKQIAIIIVIILIGLLCILILSVSICFALRQKRYQEAMALQTTLRSMRSNRSIPEQASPRPAYANNYKDFKFDHTNLWEPKTFKPPKYQLFLYNSHLTKIYPCLNT